LQIEIVAAIVRVYYKCTQKGEVDEDEVAKVMWKGKKDKPSNLDYKLAKLVVVANPAFGP